MTGTKDLNNALDGARDKIQSLNDSLKNLASEGLDGVNRALKPASANTAAASAASQPDGGYSIVVHNNAPVAVSARRTTDSFDRKALEITIDKLVADALSHGTETTGILRALFGLVPGLIGR